MNTPTNFAAWLPARRSALAVSAAAMPVASAGELVIRSRALAINPFDGVVQTLGGFVTPWVTYPAVLGTDVAGEVVSVGAGVSRLRVGDRVVGLALGVDKVANRAAEGAFQAYVLLRQDATTRIPDTVSFEQAAVLPLAVATAASGLFLESQLGLRRPSAAGAAPVSNEAVVVWGGATSVGSSAIQLAVAAGYRVVATASPKNFELVRRLGASTVIDYRGRQAVDQVVAAVGRSRLVGVLAIAAGSGIACIDIAARCPGRKIVVLASAPLPLDDAPLKHQLAWRLSRLPRVGLGFLRLALRARRKGVATRSLWGTALVGNALCAQIFVDFLEPALAESRFKPAPEPLVAGHSLQDIPEAMALLRGGVSARKVVVVL